MAAEGGRLEFHVERVPAGRRIIPKFKDTDSQQGFAGHFRINFRILCTTYFAANRSFAESVTSAGDR